MGDLILKGGTSGQITVTPTAVAGTNTLTLPAKTGNIITSADSGTVTQTMLQVGTPSVSGVVGTGPAFGAYSNNDQTGLTSGTFVKVAFNLEEFDTNSNFDSSTNYRFTAPINGYYRFDAAAYLTATNMAIGQIRLYRNGASYKTITSQIYSTSAILVSGGCLIYLAANQYVEFYVFGTTSAGTFTIGSGEGTTYCSGYLARIA